MLFTTEQRRALVQTLREADAAGARKDAGKRLQYERHPRVVVAADGLRRRESHFQQLLSLLKAATTGATTILKGIL
jgi:hypothetical protein